MIYISLTTVPLRMAEWNSAKANLESLLNQNTQRDYRVVLTVPYKYKIKNDEEYTISEELKQLANDNPKLIINRTEDDFGPIMKILGVLPLADPDDILIVCDDDHYYHEDMLEYHLQKRTQYPEAIISFRGDVPVDKRSWVEEDGTKKYVLRSTHFYFPVKNDSHLVIPGHWHSVGYVRRFFEDDFHSDEIMNSSNNDDILVGYYFRKKQREIICAKWDNETDWRPVNEYGRPSYSFPVKYTLPMPDSGFNEFRRQHSDGYGKVEEYTRKLIGDHFIIYIEK